jgi:hypothetical protein
MARTRFDHARMLLASDREAERERARKLLEEARALADELRMSAVVEWIDSARPEPGEAARSAVEPLAAGMHREGEVWRFDYNGRVFRVGDSKGMRHIAVLLATPGVQIPAGEVEARAGPSGNGAGVDAAAAADAGLAAQASPDAALVGLDTKARREYQRRLEDLRDDIEQAEAWNDPERAARARQEMDFIASELAAAVGLGGRDRPLASGAERARVRVTRAIRRAIQHIGAQDEALAQELRTTIETGSFCAYAPDLRHPVTWEIDGQ